jgi:hypothetical protein
MLPVMLPVMLVQPANRNRFVELPSVVPLVLFSVFCPYVATDATRAISVLCPMLPQGYFMGDVVIFPIPSGTKYFLYAHSTLKTVKFQIEGKKRPLKNNFR